MADSERRTPPALWMLVLALFGVYTIPRASTTGPAPAASKSGAKTLEAGAPSGSKGQDEKDGEEGSIGQLLLDHFTPGGRRPPGGVGTPEALLRACAGPPEVRCLIATLADPVRSTSGYHFDEGLKAILQGVESRHYVLDRYWVPWLKDAGGRGDRAPSPRQQPDQAGLLVFRHDGPLRCGPKAKAPAPDRPLLLVFLVPESPTSGLNKAALAESLDWAEALDGRNRDSAWLGPPCTINILGPTFTGSRASLAQGLRTWLGRGSRWARPFEFDVVSGSASGIAGASLEEGVNDALAVGAGLPGKRLRYRTTVHHDAVVREAMYDFLNVRENQVALLYESNTGYGQSTAARGGDPDPVTKAVERNVHRYPFPQHVSRIRALYEKQDASGGSTAIFPASERLAPGSGEGSGPRDLIAPQTPEFTTPVDELVIDEILLDVERRGIRTVGISATDVRDVIFLASKIRRMIPDARVFTTQNDLVFTHPKWIADLRGMFVASTYPLVARNQSWSYPNEGDRRSVFFASDDAQGVYNATVLQLNGLCLRDEPDEPVHLVEYGSPFVPPDKARLRENAPPVWIGVVGNHGVYPLRVATAGARQGVADDIYKYQPEHEAARDDADPVDLFRPGLRPAWALLVLGLSAFGLTLAAVGCLQARWCRRPGVKEWRPDLARLAEFLNWSRAEHSTGQGAFRGPGPFLLAALLLTSLVYVMTALPLLRVSRIGFISLDPRHLPSALTLLALLVLAALATGTAVSAWVWWVTLGADAPADAGATPQATPEPSWVRHAAAWTRERPGPTLAAVVPAAFVVAFTSYKTAEVLSRLPADGLSPDQTAALLALYRSNALSSGVSPVFPLLFLGAAGLGWVYVNLKRRQLYEQATPTGPKKIPEPQPTDPPDKQVWQEILRDRREFEEATESPWGLLVRHPVALALTLAFGAYLLWNPVVRTGDVRTVDDVAYLRCLTVLFAIVFMALACTALQLALMWGMIRALLHGVAQLPLVRAMDRLPARAVRWLYNPTASDVDRFEMVRRQAQALAAKSTESVLQELDACGIRPDPGEWDKLMKNLAALGRSGGDDPLRLLRTTLSQYWRSQAVTAAFAEAPDPSTGKTGGEGEFEGLRGIAMALSGSERPRPRPKAELPEWVQAAEDLVALISLRWLAASAAQVWLMMGFLVVGALCLLLAASSYPFPWQSQLLFAAGVLVAASVLLVSAVALGMNRDEVISRVGNTTPHRLKLDQPLLMNLFTYVVPLLGALAAISFDASDTLRTWLDAIVR